MGAPAAPGQKDGHGHGHSMSWKEMKAQLYKLKDVQLCPDPDTLVFFMLAVVSLPRQTLAPENSVVYISTSFHCVSLAA